MLEVRDLAVSYGGHRALEGVSVAVARGEICVILGANGAGKSTLLKAIAGIVRPEPGGAIAIAGHAVAGLKPNRIVEAGIALVPEGRGIFPDLTVAENLELGAYARRARRDAAATRARILELFPRLGERRRQLVRSMSGGEQQMVAIGRALMSRPDVLMLDEPSLGLSPLLAKELFRSLTDVAATGVGILLVEQNARASLKIAGRGYLIENGLVAGENTAEALLRDPDVIRAYLGGGLAALAPSMPLPPALPLPAAADALAAHSRDLAERAGRIRAAYTLTARQAGALPSAFVGRYDPKAVGDPWAGVAVPIAPQPPKAAEPARRIAAEAPTLAARAAERLAAHVTSNRLSAPRPSGFRPRVGAAEPPQEAPPPLPDSPGIGHNSAALPGPLAPEALASGAASIHAAHVAERRRTLTAFLIPARPAGKADPDPKAH